MGKINAKEMIRFYEQLDVIKFKYGEGKDYTFYKELEAYEAENQMFMLTKRSYEDAAENLNLVYGEKKKTDDSIELLDLILNKIIGQYINIDGMERLFSLSYIDFEWEMHLSADYKMHHMKYYRDHFIHQIRDAYMAHQFLSEYGFADCVQAVLENESISKISRYVQKCLSQQRRKPKDDLRLQVEQTDPDFYMRNLIYMSAYMASLFHDIGYPEAHHLSSSERIVDYIAGLYNISDASENSHKISALLQNSLLFRLVPFEEIREKINSNQDHGAISAVVFLLNFYENGAIFRLPPYKSAAIELAGLAIYNHTNVYALVKPKKKKWDAERPCFTANPIAYLLRLSDDLQEWDRTYFLVSNNSNILFCNRCHTPLIGRRIPDEEGILESHYVCNCKGAVKSCLAADERNTCFVQAFDGKSKFSYRRIYNVTVCDELEITRKEQKTKRDRLLISLKYDSYKLLHAAFAHPTYAKHRIKELNELKLILEMQDVMPYVYLDYFVTSNPVHIKVRMIEEYLESQQLDEEFGEWYKKEPTDIDSLKSELLASLTPVLEEFCLHENFCRECLYCRNLVDAVPKMQCLKDNAENASSICQHEWNIKCLTWKVMGKSNISSEDMANKIALDPGYIKRKTEKEKKNLSIPDYEEVFRLYKDTEADLFCNENPVKLEQALDKLKEACPLNRLYQYSEKALNLYIDLYICQKLSRLQNMKPKKERSAVWDNYLKERKKTLVDRYSPNEELCCLIEDCFLQFERMYEDITKLNYYPDAYYQQYRNVRKTLIKSKDDQPEKTEYVEIPYYYTAALRYISADKYVPYFDRSEEEQASEYIDAYTDLYFFRLLKERMDKKTCDHAQ